MFRAECVIRVLPGRIAILLISVAIILQAAADPIQIPVEGLSVNGIMLDSKGAIHFADPDPKAMEEARAKAKAASPIAHDARLCYISLPRLTMAVKALREKDKEVPEEIRYLGGMTRIQYVFVYPDDRELVIAGPAEPWDATNPLEVVGKVTGRPVMQFDDLIAAMRTARSMRRGGENGGAFGCSIDFARGVEGHVAKLLKEHADKPRPEKLVLLAKGIGEQKVKIFNTDDDTRLAFICAAADCKLKRIALGVEEAPVPGIGAAVESSRAPTSHVWFEMAYQPLLASEDGYAFELRGARLQVKVGEDMFTDKDATHRAIAFARLFNLNMDKMCAAVPLFADLQNMADLSMVATLIRLDNLNDKVKWDALDVYAVIGWPVMTLPPARTVDALVNYTNGAICYGGVSLASEPLLDPEKRRKDVKQTLKPLYDGAQKLLEDTKAGPILARP